MKWMLPLAWIAWFAVAPTPIPQSILDRPVARNHHDQPLLAFGVNTTIVHGLAARTGVPMGFEEVPREAEESEYDWLISEPRNAPRRNIPRPDPIHEDRDPIVLSGRTLQSAVEALVSLDSRYEWQEMDGVVVIRPVVAWQDPKHVLSTPVTGIDLREVPGREAMALAARLLGHPDGRNFFPDTRRFSVNVPNGTVLDVLNAIVREHGELAWTLEWTASRRSPSDPACWLTLYPMNGGAGHGIGILPGRR